MHRGLPSLCLLFTSITAARPTSRLYYCDLEVNERNNEDEDEDVNRNCL